MVKDFDWSHLIKDGPELGWPIWKCLAMWRIETRHVFTTDQYSDLAWWMFVNS